MEPVEIRAARDADADELIALIGAVFDEYPGCVLDVDGEMPELRAIASAFNAASGRFWVAEQAGRCTTRAPRSSTTTAKSCGRPDWTRRLLRI